MRASWMVGITVLGWLLVSCQPGNHVEKSVPLEERLPILVGAQRTDNGSRDGRIVAYYLSNATHDQVAESVLRQLKDVGREWQKAQVVPQNRVWLEPMLPGDTSSPKSILIETGEPSGFEALKQSRRLVGTTIVYFY
ncbi:MAG TPA: hypothetical protein PLS15_12705 [Fimbriimonadaceae bacterium]|nr:hypothetical protein [Fimbriimonadaceae bacterium]HRE94582.1 hypothetical protein [Fimbriimonadaceae bacterium]